MVQRKLNKEDLKTIYLALLGNFVSKANDKRSYTSLNRITISLNKLSNKFLNTNFNISNETVQSILTRLGYDYYIANRSYKDDKSSVFDSNWEEIKYDVDIKDVKKLESLTTVFSSKHNRREDRQTLLENLLEEYYKITLVYCVHEGINVNKILTTKLTEPLFYGLRELLKSRS